MKCVDIHSICLLSDDRCKTLSHILRSFVGKCQTEDVRWTRIGQLQDIRGSHREKLGFSASWTCNNQNRSINRIDRFFLLCIQFFVPFSKRRHRKENIHRLYEKTIFSETKVCNIPLYACNLRIKKLSLYISHFFHTICLFSLHKRWRRRCESGKSHFWIERIFLKCFAYTSDRRPSHGEDLFLLYCIVHMLFSEFWLRPEILSSLEALGYTEPTPVQEAVIPQALEEKNLIVQSQTGSGKTASFVIPVLNLIDTNLRKPQGLILSPTRELAIQSKEEVWNLSKWIRMRSMSLSWGSNIRRQRDELASGPQVIMSTPGRLIDLIERKWIDLSAIKILVIDEVDLMMDMGFIEAVEMIWKSLPNLKQIMTFSATYSPQIMRIISENIGTNYESIQIHKTVTVETIEHSFVRVPRMDKYPMLRKIVTENPESRIIVFTKMKSETEELFRYLERDGIKSAYLHGDLFQRDRIRTLRDYKEGRIRIFIATDIAARGLNMNNIDLVVNYHVPLDPESYIHRIGRTWRAGANGKAIMFVSSDETRQLERVERVNRIEIEEIDQEGNAIPRAPKTFSQKRRGNGGASRRSYHGARDGGGRENGPRENRWPGGYAPRHSSPSQYPQQRRDARPEKRSYREYQWPSSHSDEKIIPFSQTERPQKQGSYYSQDTWGRKSRHPRESRKSS